LYGFYLALYLNFSMELMKCISLRGGRATFWYLASGIKRKAKFVRTLHPPLLSVQGILLSYSKKDQMSVLQFLTLYVFRF
jgi:hypothetical protein